MDVQIRFFDAGTLSDPVRFADAYARVSAPRRAKIDRLRSDAARRLSLAAGVLLTDTLAELGFRGLSAEEAVDENGKPWLPRCPGLHFSLSHSGVFAMCAAGPSSLMLCPALRRISRGRSTGTAAAVSAYVPTRLSITLSAVLIFRSTPSLSLQRRARSASNWNP